MDGDLEQLSHHGSIAIRVVYQDLPDLIELRTSVRIRDWSGAACAYASPHSLVNEAQKLVLWSRHPEGEFRIDAGADTGIGWLVLSFRTVDMAGHIVCHVTLATSDPNVCRLAVNIRTEAGLVERFANELISLARTLKGDAVLIGVQP